jgi:hypothetical protein
MTGALNLVGLRSVGRLDIGGAAMKAKTAVGSATVLALSCAAVPAVAAECTANVFFSTYLSGGPNANCTIADKTILGISQNEIANGAGVLINDIFDTPADDPGIEFHFTTVLPGVDGASFVFSVTAPSSSSIDGVSLSVEQIPSGSATLTASLSNSLALSASLGESNTINFTPTGSLIVTLSEVSSGGEDQDAPNVDIRFSEGPAVPEPSSAALVGVGLAVGGLVRWRKRRAGASKTG